MIWRVMSLDKLETLIVRRGLWLSRLDQFGTEYEGLLPRQNHMGLLAMHPAPDAEWLFREYARGVNRSYASCWHAQDGLPDHRVWKAFNEDGQGVAVRVEAAELLRQLELVSPGVNSYRGGGGPIHYGAVRYIDHHVDTIPDGNILEAQFVVRDKWSYQTELRVLVHTYGTAAYRLTGKNGPFGPMVEHVLPANSTTGQTELIGGYSQGKALVIFVDPIKLVRSIVPNPRMSPENKLRLGWLAVRAQLLSRVDLWRLDDGLT